jgi:hypothetical protein
MPAPYWRRCRPNDEDDAHDATVADDVLVVVVVAVA